MGCGYKNLAAQDPMVHSMAAKGQKQPQYLRIVEIHPDKRKRPETPYGYRVKHHVGKKYGYTTVVSRGGFSRQVWEDGDLQDYAKSSIVAGYIGSSGRTKWKDAMLERALAKKGLSSYAIAIWVTSTDGRHLGSEDYKSPSSWRKRLNEYLKDPLSDVKRWEQDGLDRDAEYEKLLAKDYAAKRKKK